MEKSANFATELTKGKEHLLSCTSLLNDILDGESSDVYPAAWLIKRSILIYVQDA
jgi:hypothetical protein